MKSVLFFLLLAGMSTAMAASKKVTALRHRNSSPTQLRARPRIRQYSTGVGANGSNGPGSLSDQEMREKRFSKTLPRGFSLANSEAAGAEFSDVYGLYGDLLNVTDYSFVEGQGDQKTSQHNGKHNGGRAAVEKNPPRNELGQKSPQLSAYPKKLIPKNPDQKEKS